MANLRELSKQRIHSLEALGQPVNLKDLEHMIEGDFIDLDKARNFQELATAERISKDPRRQSIDEKNQLITLQTLFGDVHKPDKQTYIAAGYLTTDPEKVGMENPLDIDAVQSTNGWQVVWTLKGGQNCDGTSQKRQFMNVLQTIEQAPRGLDYNRPVFLAVYVSGSFWTKQRKKYLEFKHTNPKFSLVDLLRNKAKGRKCVVLSDDNLPDSKSSFYDKYILGKHVK